MSTLSLTPVSYNGRTSGIPTAKVLDTNDILYMNVNATTSGYTDIQVLNGKQVDKWVMNNAIADIQTAISTPVQFRSFAVKYKNGRKFEKTIYLNVSRISKVALDPQNTYTYPGQGTLAARDKAGDPKTTSKFFYNVGKPQLDTLGANIALSSILSTLNTDAALFTDITTVLVNGRKGATRFLLNNANIKGTYANTETRYTEYMFQNPTELGIDIYSVNTAPVAADYAYSMVKNTTFTKNTVATGLLKDCTDANGNALIVTAQTAASTAHGTVTVQVNGKFSYTPTADYTGTDTFNYVITDTNGATDTGTVTMTITNS